MLTRNILKLRRTTWIVSLVMSGLVLQLFLGEASAQDPLNTDPPPVGSSFECDVCVYGATASGMLSAIAAAKEDKSVIIVEPSRWLGGIVGGGIRGMLDCKYLDDIGGLTLEMREAEYAANLGTPHYKGQLWFRQHFLALAQQHGLQVIYQHRLGTVDKDGNRIRSLGLDYAPVDAEGCPVAEATTSEAVRITAKVFIDASYEGDLMARAGVSYVVGRESREQYGESLGGQRNLQYFNVSPYVVADDPESGLLPMIDTEPYEEGAASRHIMGYNFRMQWVNGGQPIGEPSQYDEALYALARRAQEHRAAGMRRVFDFPCTNFSRAGMLSSGVPGLQSEYPDADWPDRARIWRAWIDHVKIMHDISGSSQGFRQGEYPDTNEFPNQLYVRLGRRMVSDYVMTQHDLMCQTTISDPIGLGYYKVDIYPCRLIATPDGRVASEGATFVMTSPGPYQIPYRSLHPREEECSNLLVPVCIASTHVALSSIRMEPTFMVMGEAAGIAAVRAIEEETSVQQINAEAYRQALLDAGQVIEWDGRGYRFGQEGWWVEHPEEYQARPVDTIYVD